VVLGIGVKVATLPVIALGVGIGVDYALYLLSVQLHGQRLGLPLAEAYRSHCRSPVASSRWWASLWRRCDHLACRRSSSRPTWASCSRSCSCGTCSAR